MPTFVGPRAQADPMYIGGGAVVLILIILILFLLFRR